MKGSMRGPFGEAVTNQTQRLNAERSSLVGGKAANAASTTGNLRTLIHTLSSREAAASGLSSHESATAAQALAKAYQDVNQFDMALEYYHQALAAREFLLGPTHPT